MSDKNNGKSNSKMILFGLVLGTFMTALDATIVSVAIPTMAAELGEAGHDTSNISWVLLVYTLMLCCFVLLWSKMGSKVGYKKIFVIGIGIFTVSSLAIGLCGFIEELGLGAIILLRAVQGIGAGMSMATSLAMVSTYLPPEVRGSSIGAVTLSASAGTAFGPAIGGLLTTFHWSYIFFINVPIGIFCVLLCLKFMNVKEDLPTEKSKLDLPGVIFMLIMMFSLVFYLNKGSDIGWMSKEGISLILATCIGAGLLAWWENRAKDPLIEFRLIRDVNINRSNIVAMVLFMAMSGSYLLLPYYLQFIQGYETMQYGVILIANSIGMMVSGPLVGKMSDRTGNNRMFIVAGCLVCALGFFMMTEFGMDTSLLYILLALFVMGAGMGMAVVSSTNLAFEYILPGEDGQLSGINKTYCQAGSSAGVAILNAIFMASIPAVGALTSVSDLLPGFRHAFFVAMIISLIGFIIAMPLKDKNKEANSA